MKSAFRFKLFSTSGSNVTTISVTPLADFWISRSEGPFLLESGFVADSILGMEVKGLREL